MSLSCTVIIPVGPGHQQLAQQALQSVMLASEDMVAFDEVHVVVGDDTEGKRGRSATRNAMVRGAAGENGDARKAEPWMMLFSTGDSQDAAFTSEWLFFLDADDLMCTPQFFGESAFKTVSPFLDEYDAIWGTINELHPNGQVVRRSQVDRITTFKAYVRTPSVLSCQMGHFVRRECFLGFNEELDVCEDVDLYIREWRTLRCIKQEKPLFLNRRGAHTWMNAEPMDGRKVYTGRDWSMRAEAMLKKARDEL